MSDPTRRSRLEAIAAEIERRKNKKIQSNPDGGLMEFVRYFWDVLEPNTEFVYGWPLEAVCKHLEAVSRGEITKLLINVPPGFMKPISVEEPILTDQGFVRLGDIKVGDKVLTHKGRFKKVLAVHEQGELDVVRVTTQQGRSVIAAPDHPFLTTRGWIAAGDLKPNGDYVAVPRVDEDMAGKRMSPEEARLLGYLVGDGCISHKSLSFVNMEKEIIDDFIYCAKSCGFYAREIKHPHPKTKASKIIFKSTEKRWTNIHQEPPVLTWLKSHNLFLSNSYTKRIPPAVFASGKEAVANFIGAYWSCDGMIKTRHADKRTTMVSIATTVSEGLAKDLQQALMILNIQSRVRTKLKNLISKKQPGGKYKVFDIATSQRNEVAKFASLPGLVTYKKENAKLAFFDQFDPPLFADEVIAVDQAGKAQCRCLTVEEDASFTVNGLAVHNSLLTDVFWPAWEWGPMNMPYLRYVAFSYSAGLTERDNGKFRDLILSKKYKDLWGDVFEAKKIGEVKITNSRTGSKLATSVGGIGTGERGDRIIVDDAHNIKDGESDTIRSETTRWFREALSNRLNDMEKSAIVVIMQRVHEADVSGVILSEIEGYEHLMIPMEYDQGRVCQTSIGWEDPREEEGELAWPERFPPEVVDNMRSTLGPYAYAGQYQQCPTPRGGGIFKREWWNLWNDPFDAYPPLEFVLVSVDTAYTKKEENDPSACTVWGLFRENGAPRIMLLYAWRKHLELHGKYEPRGDNESNEDFRRRTQPLWGLIEWIAYTCRRYKADRLIIEGKASGLSVAQEIQRLYGYEGWGVEIVQPQADKVARAHAVQPIFSQLLVYAPDRDWADMVIDEMSTFPKGRYKDLTDSTTQAMKFLRDSNMIVHRHELEAEFEEGRKYRGKLQPLYPV